MKKRFLIIGLIAICAISLGLSAACFAGKKGESTKVEKSNYAIEGVMDVVLSVTQTEYDFLKGVVGWEGQTQKTVTVDSSKVKFGEAGAYEITYKLGDVSKTAVVKIYGTPVIVGDDTYDVYYEEDLDVFADVKGKDTFGVDLTVTTNNEFEKDAFGRIIYGDHFFRYYVTDAAGNMAYLDRTYTVNPPFGYEFDDVVVTIHEPEAKFDMKDKTLSYIVYNNDIVPANSYVVKDGVLDLSYFVIDLGLGRHELSLTFTGGYSNVIVDVQITAAQFYGKKIEGEEKVSLFNVYTVEGSSSPNYVEWDEKENAFHFVNLLTEQYDVRGFYMDPTYFSNIIEKGQAKKMIFDVKFDSTLEDANALGINMGFYVGFIPEWYEKPSMILTHYASGYQTIVIDLTKVEYENGQYKTLFMLATVGGFYVKNIEFQF